MDFTSPDIPDTTLLSLPLLYGKTLPPALKLASEHGSVVRLTAPCGRTCHRVKSNNVQEPFYQVFSHYCSCPAFLHEVCLRGESLTCKHILAVQIQSRQSMQQELEISDIDLANHLMR